MQTDVIQLAQIFHDFRMKIFNFGQIDIAKYVGMPSAAFSIFLKKSECEIGLIQNEEMLGLFMSGIRGGMSFIGNRYAFF